MRSGLPTSAYYSEDSSSTSEEGISSKTRPQPRHTAARSKQLGEGNSHSMLRVRRPPEATADAKNQSIPRGSAVEDGERGTTLVSASPSLLPAGAGHVDRVLPDPSVKKSSQRDATESKTHSRHVHQRSSRGSASQQRRRRSRHSSSSSISSGWSRAKRPETLEGVHVFPCRCAGVAPSSSSSSSPSPSHRHALGHHANSPRAASSPSVHIHCVELAEVCAGIEQYVEQQAKLIQRLHFDVQQTKKEWLQAGSARREAAEHSCCHCRCRCCGGGSSIPLRQEVSSSSPPSEGRRPTAPKETGEACSNSPAKSWVVHDGAGDTAAQQTHPVPPSSVPLETLHLVVKQLVHEELQRQGEEGRASSPTPDASRRTNVPPSGVIKMAQGSPSLDVGERLASLQTTCDALRRELRSTNEEVAALRELASTAAEQTAAAVQSADEAEREKALRESIKEQVTSVLQRSTVRMTAKFEQWRTDMEQRLSSAHHTEMEAAKSPPPLDIAECEQKLEALQRANAEVEARLETICSERHRFDDVHRFNTALYQEFKDWVSDLEKRAASRSEVLRLDHRLRDVESKLIGAAGVASTTTTTKSHHPPLGQSQPASPGGGGSGVRAPRHQQP